MLSITLLPVTIKMYYLTKTVQQISISSNQNVIFVSIDSRTINIIYIIPWVYFGKQIKIHIFFDLQKYDRLFGLHLYYKLSNNEYIFDIK